MKKIFVSLVCILVCAASFAQDKAKHLMFLSEPIDGTVSAFVEKMEKKGFDFNANIDKNAVMMGEYDGYKNVTLFIQSCTKKDLVFGIGVTFEHQQKWDSLLCNYNALKAELTKKYGKPAECTEKFAGDSTVTLSEDQKMEGVRAGNCEYFTVYKTAEGTINLAISRAQYGEEIVCYVQLDFLDKQNVANEKTITKKIIKSE